MANQKQLNILLESIDSWNSWRQNNPEIVPDLSEANLSQLDLRYADLRNADLTKADLQNADLQKADLRNAKLESAKLQNAQLQSATLTEANLTWANFTNADLRRANLDQAILYKTCFSHTNLVNTNLDQSGYIERLRFLFSASDIQVSDLEIELPIWNYSSIRFMMNFLFRIVGLLAIPTWKYSIWRWSDNSPPDTVLTTRYKKAYLWQFNKKISEFDRLESIGQNRDEIRQQIIESIAQITLYEAWSDVLDSFGFNLMMASGFISYLSMVSYFIFELLMKGEIIKIILILIVSTIALNFYSFIVFFILSEPILTSNNKNLMISSFLLAAISFAIGLYDLNSGQNLDILTGLVISLRIAVAIVGIMLSIMIVSERLTNFLITIVYKIKKKKHPYDELIDTWCSLLTYIEEIGKEKARNFRQSKSQIDYYLEWMIKLVKKEFSRRIYTKDVVINQKLQESINQLLCCLYFVRKELIISKNKYHIKEILKDFTNQFISFVNDGLLECVENSEKFDIKKFKNISSVNLLSFVINSVVTVIKYSIPLLIIYFIGLEATKIPEQIQPIYKVVKPFSEAITLTMIVLIINNLGGIIDSKFVNRISTLRAILNK
ncbi:MAG: pentapeptide repeat-containing protein [Crocosphaera sp.]|nr:pentapeptide repeat-containing protein [Crocosphaera sp.]